MSNVFSNASFAVLSVMNTHNPKQPDGSQTWVGSTAYVQRKPEADYPNIMVVSFSGIQWSEKDFSVQARFDANIAANIMSEINGFTPQGDAISVVNSNTALSPKSYKMTAVEIT